MDKIGPNYGVPASCPGHLGVHLQRVHELLGPHQVVPLGLQPLGLLLVRRRGRRLLLHLQGQESEGGIGLEMVGGEWYRLILGGLLEDGREGPGHAQVLVLRVQGVGRLQALAGHLGGEAR